MGYHDAVLVHTLLQLGRTRLTPTPRGPVRHVFNRESLQIRHGTLLDHGIHPADGDDERVGVNVARGACGRVGRDVHERFGDGYNGAAVSLRCERLCTSNCSALTSIARLIFRGRLGHTYTLIGVPFACTKSGVEVDADGMLEAEERRRWWVDLGLVLDGMAEGAGVEAVEVIGRDADGAVGV